MLNIFKSCTPWTSADKKENKIVVWYLIPQGRGRRRRLNFELFNTQTEADNFIKTLKR